LAPLGITSEEGRMLYTELMARLPFLIHSVKDSLANATKQTATVPSYASARASVVVPGASGNDAKTTSADDDLEGLLDEAQSLLDATPIEMKAACLLPSQGAPHTIEAKEAPLPSTAAEPVANQTFGFGGRNRNSSSVSCLGCNNSYQMQGVLAYCRECAGWFCRNCVRPPTATQPYQPSAVHPLSEQITALRNASKPVPDSLPPGFIQHTEPDVNYLELIQPLPSDLRGLITRLRSITDAAGGVAGTLHQDPWRRDQDDSAKLGRQGRVTTISPPTVDQVTIKSTSTNGHTTPSSTSGSDEKKRTSSPQGKRDGTELRNSSGVVAQFNRSHPWGRHIADQKIEVLFSHSLSDAQLVLPPPTSEVTNDDVLASYALQIMNIATSMVTRLTPILNDLLAASAPARASTTGSAAGQVWTELGLDSPSSLLTYIINTIMDRIATIPERQARRDAHAVLARRELHRRKEQLIKELFAAIVAFEVYQIVPAGGVHGEARKMNQLHRVWSKVDSILPVVERDLEIEAANAAALEANSKVGKQPEKTDGAAGKGLGKAARRSRPVRLLIEHIEI
jgi:hypothetical protein